MDAMILRQPLASSVEIRTGNKNGDREGSHRWIWCSSGTSCSTGSMALDPWLFVVWKGAYRVWNKTVGRVLHAMFVSIGVDISRNIKFSSTYVTGGLKWSIHASTTTTQQHFKHGRYECKISKADMCTTIYKNKFSVSEWWRTIICSYTNFLWVLTIHFPYISEFGGGIHICV